MHEAWVGNKNDPCCWMILVYHGNAGSSECWPHPNLHTHFSASRKTARTAGVPGAYPFRGGSTVLWQSNLSSRRAFFCHQKWALWPPDSSVWVDKSSRHRHWYQFSTIPDTTQLRDLFLAIGWHLEFLEDVNPRVAMTAVVCSFPNHLL